MGWPTFPDFHLCNLPWISCQSHLSDLRTQRGSLSRTGTYVSLENGEFSKAKWVSLQREVSSLQSPWCEQSMQCFPRLFNHEITVFLLCGYFMGLFGHKCTLWNNQKFSVILCDPIQIVSFLCEFWPVVMGCSHSLTQNQGEQRPTDPVERVAISQ